MASRYEVEVKISSARDIKNVNWRNGPTRPYAVVWVDPRNKCSTRSDDVNDTNPTWDETLVIPLPAPIDDDTALFIDVVHAGSEPDTKRLIGSARLRLRDVVDEVGFGERATRALQLKRPSGRPHGKVDVTVSVRDPYAYAAPPPASATAYGIPPPASAYGAPARDPYYAGAVAPPPSGYPYGGAAYGPPGYGGAGYGAPAYGGGVAAEEKKKSKFGGMGTGLAVGAVAGVLGGLALAEGAEYVEDKIADDAAEKVEDDLGYDGDDF